MKKFGINIYIEESPNVLPLRVPYHYSNPDEDILHPRILVHKRRVYIRVRNDEERKRFIRHLNRTRSLSELKSFLLAIIHSDGYYNSPFSGSLKKDMDIQSVEDLCSKKYRSEIGKCFRIFRIAR